MVARDLGERAAPDLCFARVVRRKLLEFLAEVDLTRLDLFEVAVAARRTLVFLAVDFVCLVNLDLLRDFTTAADL